MEWPPRPLLSKGMGEVEEKAAGEAEWECGDSWWGAPPEEKGVLGNNQLEMLEVFPPTG